MKRMSRAAIVATIVTSILAFSSPSLAASEEEVGKFGDKMSGAFRCSTYADMFHDQKESDRLFQIGLKAARAFVEGMKSMNDSTLDNMKAWLGKTSTDFMVGTFWQDATTKARAEIVNGLSLEKLVDPDVTKRQAERSYRDSNCSLIQ
jgi:hypothetical protein